jgi:Nif-specific regulatory protein
MYARLIVEAGDCTPAAVELSPDRPATVGRSRENALVVRSDLASRLHCKVYLDDGRWVLRDFGLNGTKLNGGRITGAATLTDGAVIGIGDIRLRFAVGAASPTITPPPVAFDVPLTVAAGGPGSSGRVEGLNTRVQSYPTARQMTECDDEPSGEVEETQLKVDELTALCKYMTAAVGVAEPQELIRHTLKAVLQQTSGTVAGYLGLDPADPTPKLVLPDRAAVDTRLSRRLTEQVRTGRRLVWLYGEDRQATPDSLMSFTDAVCVPLQTPGGEAFAALHVYRTGRGFAERDVRFVEAAAGFLAPTLEAHRGRRKLAAENSRLRGVAPVADELIGDSNAVMSLRSQITRAAAQPFTVLVVGESGSGKELVAQALHRHSPRAAGPLVVVNCAALTSGSMEAELFGYRKGAFSGADHDHPGYFEQADEGTLFLDEVGELSPECQAKLLRAIDGKAFRPLGASRDLAADVRLVAATHRDLEAEVRAGRFRQDLLFRLRVISLRVPALREHAEDVPELARFFLERLSAQCRRHFKLTGAALQKLQAYAWPGNVRQLRAVLESAAVMSEADVIDADGLPLPGGEAVPAPAHPGGHDLPASLDIDDLETWAIRKALVQTGGNVSQASRILGMSRDTLHTKLKKKGIDRESVLHAVAAAE